MAMASCLFLILYFQVTSASMLYNGLQRTIISPDISDACDAVFNTSLNCAENIVQLTTYTISLAGWNTTSMELLCTTDCESSIAQLATLAESSCSNDVFPLDTGNLSLYQFVDLIKYKYGLICLRDESTQDMCLDIEDSWNITSMVAAGEATWPANTEKCYWDSREGYWQIYLDADTGNCTDPFEFEFTNATNSAGSNTMAALDYYYDTPDPIDDDNYGWFDVLEDDEYPLEIQCSSCFLQKFKYGLENSWGHIWDDVTEQVWENIRLNCDLTDTLTPANNFSGRITEGDWLEDPGPITTDCPQNLTISDSQTFTCSEAGVEFRVATAALVNMNNDIWCAGMSDRTLCAPFSCPIQVVELGSTELATDTINIPSYVSQYTTNTTDNFMSWNSYLTVDYVRQGDVVCVGPSVQVYQVSSTSTISTSTACQTAGGLASPTPSGAICGILATSITAADTGLLISYNATTSAAYVASIENCGLICLATATCTNVYFELGVYCNLHYGPNSYIPNGSGGFTFYDASCFVCAGSSTTGVSTMASTTSQSSTVSTLSSSSIASSTSTSSVASSTSTSSVASSTSIGSITSLTTTSNVGSGTSTTSSVTAATSVAGEVCVAGTDTGNANQQGLCQFACNYGYCPTGPCVCTSYGAQVPEPPTTGVAGYPLAGEDDSYLGLCSYAYNHGYYPTTACTTNSDGT